MLEVGAPDFDLALTLDSGQTFHWEPLGKGFVGAIRERAVYVEQCGKILKVRDGAVRDAKQRPGFQTPSPALGTSALPSARFVRSRSGRGIWSDCFRWARFGMSALLRSLMRF